MNDKRLAGLLIGGGLLLRLLFLGKRQLGIEELMQAIITRTDSVADMLRSAREVAHIESPLDYLVQKLSTLALGDSAWALRLHAVILGTVSLWLFFRVARWFFGSRVALYSLFLMVFFPLHYHYSQEARPYALFVCMTLLSYDCLLGIVSAQKCSWLKWMLLAGVLTLLLYSSLLGVFVLLSQCVALAVSAAMKPDWGIESGAANDDSEEDIRSGTWSVMSLYVGASLAALLAVTPWAYFSWAGPVGVHIAGTPNLKALLGLVKDLGDHSFPMTVLLLAGVVTGTRALRLHGKLRTRLWLLSWILASVPAVLLMEGITGSAVTMRHFLHTTPSLALLAGYGLSYVGERMTILDGLPYRLSSPAIAYAALWVLLSGWITQSHWHSEPVDWKGTAAYLQQATQPGDKLALPGVRSLLAYYAPILEHTGTDRIAGASGIPQGYRRLVACCQQAFPDPCVQFRREIQGDPIWQKSELRGFTIYMREAGR
jgi:hypothetical protein